MDKNFDINNIGKRMPYTVPGDFFETMEENVMRSLFPEDRQKDKTIPVRRKNIGKILLAAAAAVVLLFVIRTALTKSNTTYDFTRVEQAFNSLSADDQNYLLAIYEEDLFINEIQNQEEL